MAIGLSTKLEKGQDMIVDGFVTALSRQLLFATLSFSTHGHYFHYITVLYWTCFGYSTWFSINQSIFYSANIPDEAGLRGATAKSVFNSKIEGTVL